jgi:BON domain-containing protein/PRC-barrel domain protein
MQPSKMWTADALLNARVRNTAGEDLGKIEDVVFDPDTGNVRYVVSSFNGALADSRRPLVDRPDYVERRRPRTGISLIGAILLVCLVLGLAWATFLVATRGWDQARQDMKSSLQSAAYAAKETSKDAALTTKVKTALKLSKRIPADKIDVESDGTVVTLRGDVPSNEIRDLTEKITRDVPGVTDVQNHLFPVGR